MKIWHNFIEIVEYIILYYFVQFLVGLIGSVAFGAATFGSATLQTIIL